MSSLLALPPTTDDPLLDNLSAGDLVRYSRTCKDARSTVDSYIKRRFQLHNVLSRFLGSEQQTSSFRTLMSETGMIISGSVALQFFDRAIYPDSDLDLYLPVASARRVIDWFKASGYRYAPRKDQSHSVDEVIRRAYSNRTPSDARLGISEREPRGYLKAALVVDMEKIGDPMCRIQIVASFRSTIELILCFHSTCVMNFIAHDKAYCLFPRATLDERQAITFVAKSPDKQDKAAYDKYLSRGWKLHGSIPASEFQKTTFTPRKRYIGDTKCWTLPVHPELDGLPESIFHANSFNMDFNIHLSIAFNYEHLSLPFLLNAFVMDPAEAYPVLRVNMLSVAAHNAKVAPEGGATNVERNEAKEAEFLAMVLKYRNNPKGKH